MDYSNSKGPANAVVVQDVRQMAGSETETVKVELKLPENIYEAVKLVADFFQEPIEDWIVYFVKQELEGHANSQFEYQFEQYLIPLSKKVLKLLRVEAEASEMEIDPETMEVLKLWYGKMERWRYENLAEFVRDGMREFLQRRKVI